MGGRIRLKPDLSAGVRGQHSRPTFGGFELDDTRAEVFEYWTGFVLETSNNPAVRKMVSLFDAAARKEVKYRSKDRSIVLNQHHAYLHATVSSEELRRLGLDTNVELGDIEVSMRVSAPHFIDFSHKNSDTKRAFIIWGDGRLPASSSQVLNREPDETRGSDHGVEEGLFHVAESLLNWLREAETPRKHKEAA